MTVTVTPAEELITAAFKLDALLAGAAPDWRVTDDNHLALPVIEMPAMVGLATTSRTYAISGPNDATTLYIAAMNPLVGKVLAEMLRFRATTLGGLPELTQIEVCKRPHGNSLHLLEIARLINGSAS